MYFVKVLDCDPNKGPSEKSSVIKLIEKYGYNMPANEGGIYMLQGVQNIYLPLGANDGDEEIILKALGFNKTRNSHN